MGMRAQLRDVLNTVPMKFQVKGVRFIEKCEGRALVCDDMGLGKTLQSLAWAALHPELRPLVIVCPATLKFNWQRELKKHANLKSYICEGELTTPEQDKLELQRRLSRIKRRKKYRLDRRLRARALRAARKTMRQKTARMRKKRQEVKKQKVLIINYEIVESWMEFLVSLGVQILIIDECHYIKNRTAKRTKAVRQVALASPHVIALSGTPISGKPIEFFPVLQMVRPQEFSSYWKFGMEYCNPTRNKWSGGFDFSGSSNLDELHKRLKGIMIRRMKHKVLKQLPRKTRTVLPVEIKNRKIYEEAEENFLTWLRKKKGEDALKRAMRAEAIVRLNALKLLAAEGKLDLAINWIEDWLEDTNEKLIVFATHRKILKRLKKAFPKAAFVDGSVSNKAKPGQVSKRQKQVDRFQNNPKCRLFFGHMKAAGQGLTLTAAANVLFLEIGWTPGEHDQAEDRALRIGQTKNVSIYYLVGKGTVEERILSIIETKDEVVGRILDGKKGATMKLLQMFLKKVG